MKPTQSPRDHKFCSVCNLPYGFIRCRVTLHEKSGTRNICLICGSEEEGLAAKLAVDN